MHVIKRSDGKFYAGTTDRKAYFIHDLRGAAKFTKRADALRRVKGQRSQEGRDARPHLYR